MTPPEHVFAFNTFLAVAAEALVGFAMGFILQIAFAAPMIASEVIGTSMGIGFASAIDPQNGRSTPALGQFFSMMLTLLFLSVNGHLILVEMIVKSYDALPPGGAWLKPQQLENIAFFGGYTFLAGLLLALPGRVLAALPKPDRRDDLTISPVTQPVRGRLARQSRGRRRGACARLPGDGRLSARHHR